MPKTWMNTSSVGRTPSFDCRDVEAIVETGGRWEKGAWDAPSCQEEHGFYGWAVICLVSTLPIGENVAHIITVNAFHFFQPFLQTIVLPLCSVKVPRMRRSIHVPQFLYLLHMYPHDPTTYYVLCCQPPRDLARSMWSCTSSKPWLARTLKTTSPSDEFNSVGSGRDSRIPTVTFKFIVSAPSG
jgi:hypothetical protein